MAHTWRARYDYIFVNIDLFSSFTFDILMITIIMRVLENLDDLY